MESSIRRHTIKRMFDLFLRALSHILVPMFLIGMAGSAIVVVITLAHDIHEFFLDDGNDSAPQDTLS